MLLKLTATPGKLWVIGVYVELNKNPSNLLKLELCVFLLHYFDSFKRKLDTNYHQYHDTIFSDVVLVVIERKFSKWSFAAMEMQFKMGDGALRLCC